jgi:CheY-like chemotaxis protein
MPTVFLIEDDSTDVDFFRLALQEASVECNLIVFEDGGEIIDYVRKQDSSSRPTIPELIILDLNLPKSDGLEVLPVLRESPAFANVPVAVLSSSSSMRERAKLAAFSITEFFVKSPDLDAYLNIGKEVLRLLNESPKRSSQTHFLPTR